VHLFGCLYILQVLGDYKWSCEISLSCSYQCTNIIIPNKYRQIHSYITDDTTLL